MSASPDPWHFPRDDLARRILSVMTVGPAKALTLFGPRRTGKTEFLLKDLAPFAESEGHRVVYVSFWEAPAAPLALLLHALEASLREGSWTDRLRSGALALAPKLQLSAPLPGGNASAEIDLSALDGEPPTELLLYLGDLLERVSDARRPALLLLDEVQELARHERHESLVAALRTALDTRSDRLRAVFTGSSQAGLQAMFSEREAPFFHFATPLDLPPLDAPFVDHLLAVHRTITGTGPAREEALAAFERLHANPYFFRLVIESLVLDPSLDLGAAERRVRERLSESLGYTDAWFDLDPLQRALVMEIASGTERPFTIETRRSIGERLGAGPPSSSNVQSALRRLVRRRLLDRWAGRWSFADPGFENWVRTSATL